MHEFNGCQPFNVECIINMHLKIENPEKLPSKHNITNQCLEKQRNLTFRGMCNNTMQNSRK